MDLKIEEVADVLFNALQSDVDAKNSLIATMGQGKPNLYIAMQSDLQDVVKIDVDFPTEGQAIKNHYVIRLRIFKDGSGIGLIRGCFNAEQTYPLAAHRAVLRDARGMITTH